MAKWVRRMERVQGHREIFERWLETLGRRDPPARIKRLVRYVEVNMPPGGSVYKTLMQIGAENMTNIVLVEMCAKRGVPPPTSLARVAPEVYV